MQTINLENICVGGVKGIKLNVLTLSTSKSKNSQLAENCN